MTLTPIEFVRQRAAMIDQWGRSDPTLVADSTDFLADLTGKDPTALADHGRDICNDQRDMLIGSEMYLFTPSLADCARQALNQLEPGDYLDLDPLPVGAVFAFTDPIAAPGGTLARLSSVMLPMPRLVLVNADDPSQQLRTGLMVYTLRSTLLEYVRDQIRAGTDVADHRRAERNLIGYSAPWRLIGVEAGHQQPRPESWALLLRAAVTFARSPGIARVDRAPIPRSITRAAARAKAELPDSGVQVIDLRRRQRTPDTDPGGPATGGSTLQHRVIVRGHWRRQACGPARSERRLTWIDQHLRGPDSAPILGTHRVYLGRPPR